MYVWLAETSKTLRGHLMSAIRFPVADSEAARLQALSPASSMPSTHPQELIRRAQLLARCSFAVHSRRYRQGQNAGESTVQVCTAKIRPDDSVTAQRCSVGRSGETVN